MIKKRFVGFALFLFGLLLSLSKIALTGAVIGVSASSLISLIGALAMIAGIIIIIVSAHTARRLAERAQLDEIVAQYENDAHGDSMVTARQIIAYLQTQGYTPVQMRHSGNYQNISIQTDRDTVTIRTQGTKYAKKLAFGLDAVISELNPQQHNQLHEGQQASTRHHTTGLKRIRREFQQRRRR
jgi:hypothetical protein